jgi:hypothetical protein
MNQNIEEYLRHYCAYYQNDWDKWLPLAQIAFMGRYSASTGMSPYFVTHGYHPRLGEPLQLPETEDDATPNATPKERAEHIMRKLRNCVDFAQASMAYAQEQQRKYQDANRDPAPAYKVGDKVWLNMKNIKVHPSRKKKLSELHNQYEVKRVIGSHAYELSIPPNGIHNVFHTNLLRPAATDPLPSQLQIDYQPPPILIDDEDHHLVEAILDDEVVARGRGLRRRFLVKWQGWAEPTWEPAEEFRGKDALKDYERQTGRPNILEERMTGDQVVRRGKKGKGPTSPKTPRSR